MSHPTGPVVVCVIGKKKSGKTTFVVALVQELVARGRRVMTAKHGHHFRLDHPGTDSWKHRVDGGAERVVLAGPEGFAAFGDWSGGDELSLTELVERYLTEAEIVVAEGFKTSPYPKIEVFRRAANPEPLYGTPVVKGHPYLGIVSDDPGLDMPIPVWRLNKGEAVLALADRIEEMLSTRAGGLQEAL